MQAGFKAFSQEMYCQARDVLLKVPFRARSIAAGPDGTHLVKFDYDLLSPHTATYNYVGPSKPIELPLDSEGDA